MSIEFRQSVGTLIVTLEFGLINSQPKLYSPIIARLNELREEKRKKDARDGADC